MSFLAAGTPPRGARKALLLVIRAVIGLGALAFLAARTDLRPLGEAVGSAAFTALPAAIGLMLIVLVISSFRWGVFLRRLDIHLSVRALILMTFVGTFFNAFLPTGVGGDAYKAVRLRVVGTKLSPAFASVLLDRMAAVMALALIGMLAAAWILTAGSGDAEPPVIATALVAVPVVIVAILLVARGESLIPGGSSRATGIRAKLWRTLRSVRLGASSSGVVRKAMGLSLLSQAMTVAAHAVLGMGLGLGVPIALVAAGLTLATILAALPVSINGVGIREAAWVWMLEAQGVQSGEATAYAFLVLALYLASSAIGGLVYLLGGGSLATEPSKVGPAQA